MSDQCQRCGRSIPEETPQGLCPVCCLLDLGFGSSSLEEESVPGIELGASIGQGSSGTVYEGVELHSGYRQVAIKILRSDIAGSAQRARFLEEMQILALLDHPHLATLHRSGRTSSGNLYYVMDLVEGETLDDWAATAELSEKINILRQITEAISYAHQQGIAHRDLKPANILISKADQQVKVIDFGIARAFHGPASWGREATHLHQRIGTPHYMSPEQLAGDPKVDLRTDIWSLGLLIYELTFGKPLLAEVIDTDHSWEENAAKLRSFAFPRIPDRELDWIARKACSINPDDRYQTGQALLDDLRAREEGEAVSVGLSYRSYRLNKSFQKNRLTFTLVVAISLIVLLLGVAGWLFNLKEQRSNENIAEALTREQAQHRKTLAAESKVRRASSDNALITGTRAIDSGNYTEARESFHQALEFWPDNSAARFALNYLDATFPEAHLDFEHALPFSPVGAGPHPEGGFLLKGPDGKIYHFKNDQSLEISSHLLTSSPLVDEEHRLQIVESGAGVLEIRDLDTKALLLTPLTFGSGPEKAIYSPIDQTILVIGRGEKVRRWNLSRLREGHHSAFFEPMPRWLEYHRDSSGLLIGNQKQEVWIWDLHETPRYLVDWPWVKVSYDHWETGENHHHGVGGKLENVMGYLQTLTWLVNPKTKHIVFGARARAVDDLLIARSDGSLWLREKRRPYVQVAKAVESFTTAAISSSGEMAARLSSQIQVETIDLSSRKPIASWNLSSPALDLSILESGELAFTHANGTVTIRDSQNPREPRLTIPVVSGTEGGFHIRSIPGKEEILVCLDGDVAIRKYSTKTGELIGSPLRHQKGIYWLAVTGDPDILFSVDQHESGPGALRIWSLRLGKEIVPALHHPDRIHSVTTLDYGSRIATACADGKVRRWILERKLPSEKKSVTSGDSFREDG